MNYVYPTAWDVRLTFSLTAAYACSMAELYEPPRSEVAGGGMPVAGHLHLGATGAALPLAV
jgi:hypothetical protein